jgi:hypothetical protein
MAIDTTGWGDFKKRLHKVFLNNELDGTETPAYKISHAGTAQSGYSFGFNQMDIANNATAKTILENIIDNAKNSANALIINATQKTAIKSVWTTKGSASALSSSQKTLLDNALQSTYGISKVNSEYNDELDTIIAHIDSVVASVTDAADKAFLQGSIASKLFLADYHNQFHLSIGGKLHNYLKGQSVVLGSNTIQKEGVLDWPDLMKFYAKTKYCTDSPSDGKRRSKTVIDQSDLAAADKASYKKQVDDAFDGTASASGSPAQTTNTNTIAYSFPIDIGQATTLSPENFLKYYAHIEKEFPGGFYPIGANTVWHGGVHLKPTKDEPTDIHAVANGKIIAVRLADSKEGSVGEFGSHNFIISEHEYSGKKYFSLFMHLHFMSGSADLEYLKKLPWLNQKTSAVDEEVWKVNAEKLNLRSSSSAGASKVIESGLLRGTVVKLLANPSGTASGWQFVETLGKKGYVSAEYIKKETVSTTKKILDEDLLKNCTSGNILKLDLPILAGDIIWKTGSFGMVEVPLITRTNTLHWEIFSAEKLFPEAAEDNNAEFSPAIAGETAWVAGDAIRIKGAISNVTEAYVGQEISIAINRCSHSGVPDDEFANVKWALSVNGAAVEILAEKGKCIKFVIKEAHVGKKLSFMPHINSPSAAVSAAVIVKSDTPPGWRYIEDPDDDYIVDSAKIKEIFVKNLLMVC